MSEQIKKSIVNSELVEAFSKNSSIIFEQTPSFINDLRKKYFTEFEAIGLPTKKKEL